MRQIWLSAASSALAILAGCLGECANNVSDADLAMQVKQFMNNAHQDCAFMGPGCGFADTFNVETVTIVDKSIKDKDLDAICRMAIRVLRNYDAGSGVTMSFSSIVGDGPGIAGTVRQGDVKVSFEKYESGWRIKTD